MRNVSSAFWLRLQQTNVELAELIDFGLPDGTQYHWTTANAPLTYTLSGAATQYIPFPGQPGSGIQGDISLGVSVIDFTLANSGAPIQGQLLSSDFALASVKVGRVFTDTPDLGRLEIYNGKTGDYSYDRLELMGQARNIWKSLNVQWPYYSYQDKCAWRFGSAGCGFNTASITVAINSINVGSSTTLALLVASGYLVQSYANNRFIFGRATITGGTNSGAIRSIMAHTGDLLTLSNVLSNPDLTGLTLSIYPGCNKRFVDDCTSLYNNSKNFFGFPKIPTQEKAF